MKKSNFLNILKYFIVFFLVSGCSDIHQTRQIQFQKWMEPNNKVKVLSTTAIIDDVVKQIGGEYIDTTSLIYGELDPHTYQLVKGDDEKLKFAQVIFFNGLGLEHGPSLHHYLQDNPKAVGLGDLIYQEDPNKIIFIDQEIDPHIWMDISLWMKTIPFIVKSLSEVDPAHASVYQKNAEALQDEMIAAHAKVKKVMDQVPSHERYLVTSHDAFNYFARAYMSEGDEIHSDEWRNRFAAPEGLAPESQLSLMDIKKIIDHLKQFQIRLLFPETNVSRDSINKIVESGKQQGLDIQIACCPLYADAMGQPGSEGDTYLKMIMYNANTLATHMSSQLDTHNTK